MDCDAAARVAEPEWRSLDADVDDEKCPEFRRPIVGHVVAPMRAMRMPDLVPGRRDVLEHSVRRRPQIRQGLRLGSAPIGHAKALTADSD